MVDLNLDVNRQQIEDFRGRLDPKRIAKAARRAGNDAIAEMRMSAIAYVRARKAILKDSTIERRISIEAPASRTSLERLKWGLLVSARPISLGSYRSVQTPQGVVAEVNVGSTFRLSHAFIQVVRGGFRGVFERAGGQGSPRYPIKSLVGSGVGDTLRDPQAVDQLRTVGATVMGAAMQRYLTEELSRPAEG